MSDFRRNFLTESIKNLDNLRQIAAEDLTESWRREAFRTVHTVKGGAQTFGLETAAEIAAELENILSKSASTAETNLLLEGIASLTNALRQPGESADIDFIEKLRDAAQTKLKSDVLLTRIPPQIFKKFSEQEQNSAILSLREGKNIYCADVCFEAANFAAEYRELRKILAEKSEIIASLPSEKHQIAGKIGFQIFLASREPAESLSALVEDFDIEISSHGCTESESNDLFKMLSHVAAHIESIAEKSGKEIRVSILASDAKLSDELTKTLFDILLHLVRNAVDHAFEHRGNVEIRLFETLEGLHLSVADDGRGIDLPKLRARAVEKNLISADDLLNEDETRALVFAPELSTAARVTEISGRGVGLDAVKTAVAKLNGKISVRSRKTNGTVFEIFLPKEEI